MADNNKSKTSNQVSGNFKPIVIRYDGLDAEAHKIDLADFGKSAQGMAKIISTVATFAYTGNYKQGGKNREIRAVAGATEENCYSLQIFLETVNDNTLAAGTVAAITGGAFTVIFQWVWHKLCGRDQEMKLLHDALIKSIEQLGGSDSQERLLDTIDKMAEGLNSAAKDAVQPIGRSCHTIKFGNHKKEYFVDLDENDKAAINDKPKEVTEEKCYKVLITELDIVKKTCKISLLDDLKTRYNAEIADPQLELANSQYDIAMSERKLIEIKAKQKIYATGKIDFVISDTVQANNQEQLI